MAHSKIDTWNDNPLSSPLVEEHTEGIVWRTTSLWGKKLANLRTDIEKWRLKQELEEAKEKERDILEYLWIDTVSVDILKKKRREFTIRFSLDVEQVSLEPEFYDDLLSLYALSHPEMTQTMVQSWIAEKRNIVIEFWVSKDKNSYFIRNIKIEDDSDKKDIK